MKKQRIKITWVKDEDNWRCFDLLNIKGNFVLLRGTSDDDGTPHTGNVFWCNSSLIEVMEIVE